MDNEELRRAVELAKDSLRYQNECRLTKREEFVKAAMQGLCAAMTDYGKGFLIDLDEIADDAIGIADETLNQLRQTPEGE